MTKHEIASWEYDDGTGRRILISTGCLYLIWALVAVVIGCVAVAVIW